MRVDIITLFPEMFAGYLSSSMMDKAIQLKLLDVRIHALREYAAGKHRITDEPPFGGGGGMVLKPDPIFKAVEAILEDRHLAGHTQGANSGEDQVAGIKKQPHPIILLTPQGRLLTQDVCRELAGHEHMLLICGRYEGVDERVRQYLATDEISVGDYILTGGELAAMVLVDAVTRHIPGVLGAAGAVEDDSFSAGLLEGPQYTRPHAFRGWEVPEVLRSGHAAEIRQWKRQQSLRRTWQRRPELLLDADLTEEDKYYLMILAEEQVRQDDS